MAGISVGNIRQRYLDRRERAGADVDDVENRVSRADATRRPSSAWPDLKNDVMLDITRSVCAARKTNKGGSLGEMVGAGRGAGVLRRGWSIGEVAIRAQESG